ncbi:MAG: hypothetical protein ABIZ71_02335 [Gemmatimonadales bacterium]
MTDSRDGDEPQEPPEDEPRDAPDPSAPDGPRWPERDLGSGAAAEGDRTEDASELPQTETGEPTTTFSGGGDEGGGGWDPRRDGDRRQPTTAEQAVPWLIGLLLALTGMVIVLLALIFVGPGEVGNSPSPSPSAEPSVSVAPTASPTAVPTEEPTVTPTPAPTYGALEMVYLNRATAAAPVSLLRRDFSATDDPSTVATDSGGVTSYTWAPDGRNGAAIIGGRAVALTPGQEPRALAESVNAIVFGNDSATVFAMRIGRSGGNDVATLLGIDFVTGSTETIARITYPHVATVPDPALRESQFVDDGGLVRLYPTLDGKVVAWMLTAPATYRIDPADGTVSEVVRPPILWAPDQRYHLDPVEKSGTLTTLALRNRAGDALAAVDVSGLVSHVRWAGSSNEVVFTLGRSSPGGGVRQDLYVWDLVQGKAPSPLTSNGASFGAEWLGVRQLWLP